MAYRQNSEVYSSSSISCLDGVPFKISSAFKPPTKVQLPSTLMRNTRMSCSRHEEYSFEIEEGVLQWAVERERQLEAQKREEEELANQSREREGQRSSSDDSETDDEWLASHRSSDPPVSAVSTATSGSKTSQTSDSVPFQPVLAGLVGGNEILTPTPIHSDVNHKLSNTESQNVDVTQFENVDDPFDMFERQTLNDIEELKSVFLTTDTNTQKVFSEADKNVTAPETVNSSKENIYENVNVNTGNTARGSSTCFTSAGQAADPQSVPTEAGDYVALNEATDTCKNNPIPKELSSLPPISQTKNFLVGKIPLPPIGGHKMTPSENKMLHSEREANPAPCNMNHQSVPIYENIEPIPIYENVNIHDSGRVSYETNKCHQNDLSSVEKNSTETANARIRPSYVNVLPSKFNTAGGLTGMRNALSSPDISGCNTSNFDNDPNKREVSPVFSQSPPPRPSSQQDLSTSCSLLDVQPVSWNKYQPLPISIPNTQTFTPGSPSPKSSSSSDLASPSEIDPYLRLSPTAKHIVDNLISMGFSKPLASRAVEKFGEDEKEVIDHLCGVNNLAEKGFDTHHAETVLLLYNNNVSRAEEYLSIFDQFKQLGFSRDRIKEALVTNNLDREKALDFLTA